MDKSQELTQDNSEALDHLTKQIAQALEDSGSGKVVDQSIREKAQYDIGKAMREAKNLLNGNTKKFGDWRKKNIIGNGKHVVDSRTLTRWTSLCDFGSLEVCRKVGFTRVYKLNSKRYSELKAQISKRLNDEPEVPCKDLDGLFKAFDEKLKSEAAPTKLKQL